MSERDLEEYLQGKDPLSQRYASLRRDEPPEEIDAAVLEAAREALAPGRIDTVRPARRWFVPVTAAAMVVLSFSLVMSIVLETNRRTVGEDAIAASGQAAPEKSQRRTEQLAVAEVDSSDVTTAAEPPARQMRAATAAAPKEALEEKHDERRAESEAFAAPPPSAPERAPDSSFADAVAPAKFIDRSTPESWLEAIETLVETGELDEARSELEDFRMRWPKHELPKRLRSLERGN